MLRELVTFNAYLALVNLLIWEIIYDSYELRFP
jgi:hypothetical protein